MSKIDLDKFVCSLMDLLPDTEFEMACVDSLKAQDLKYENREIKYIEGSEPINEQEIDIDGMVERFKEGIIISQNLKCEDMMIRTIAYRKGLEDMYNKLKGGK